MLKRAARPPPVEPASLQPRAAIESHRHTDAGAPLPTACGVPATDDMLHLPGRARRADQRQRHEHDAAGTARTQAIRPGTVDPAQVCAFPDRRTTAHPSHLCGAEASCQQARPLLTKSPTLPAGPEAPCDLQHERHYPKTDAKKAQHHLALRLPVFARSHASSSPGHSVGENTVPQSPLSARDGACVWSYPLGRARIGTKPTASEVSRRSADEAKTSRTSTFIEKLIAGDLRALAQRPTPPERRGQER